MRREKGKKWGKIEGGVVLAVEGDSEERKLKEGFWLRVWEKSGGWELRKEVNGWW